MRPLLLFILNALAQEDLYYDGGGDYIIGGKAADVDNLSFVVFFDFMVRQKIIDLRRKRSNYRYPMKILNPALGAL